MPQTTFSFGVDFGTTNTVVARAGTDGSLDAIVFEHRGVAHDTYPSALCFEQVGARSYSCIYNYGIRWRRKFGHWGCRDQDGACEKSVEYAEEEMKG